MAIDKASVSQPSSRPGPFLAKVVSHQDPSYMGSLEVEILRPVGNDSSTGQTHQVKYMSPFYGVTGVNYTSESPNDFNNTQKSYGMWMIPPDPGTTVVVIFIDGDPKRGYWIGCVQDDDMNFMVPGIAATQYVVDGSGRQPVAEYNKNANQSAHPDGTKVPKPRHPFADALDKQGLILDDIRGTTTSSARRETPSAVFGVSTPGPLDKGKGAKRGSIGKNEYAVVQAPVSRLGGSTFVMDDGDDKFLRKTDPATGGPEYTAVEQGETGGITTIPHNELIRLRTRTGHQILMHNSEDLIYIGNSRGTAWIELTSNGKIDVYSLDSISIHSQTDINLTADRDINLTTHKGSINLNSGSNINASSVQNIELLASKDGKITVAKNLHLKSTHHMETSEKIDMNNVNAVAVAATNAPFAMRVPMPEPWWAHENLNPTLVMTDKTVSIAPDDKHLREDLIKQVTTVPPDIATTTPAYKKPTTKNDTFAKVGAKK